MMTRFRDRTEAGQQLAQQLRIYANRADGLVLALPRGGGCPLPTKSPAPSICP